MSIWVIFVLLCVLYEFTASGYFTVRLVKNWKSYNFDFKNYEHVKLRDTGIVRVGHMLALIWFCFSMGGCMLEVVIPLI